MSVEDHHKFEQWATALDDMKDAKDRFVQARAARDPELEAYRAEFLKAKAIYDELANALE